MTQIKKIALEYIQKFKKIAVEQEKVKKLEQIINDPKASDDVIINAFSDMTGLQRQPNLIFMRDKLHSEAKIKEWLKSRIPENFQLGAAYGGGDCFFDVIAQALNQLNGKEIYSVKTLRLFCNDYAKNSKHTWVKNAIVKDRDNYEQYLARIQFTAKEMEANERNGLNLGSAIWGRTKIEGRMFCEAFGIKLHIIEIQDDGHIIEFLVDAAGECEEINPKVNYNDPKIFHMVNYHNHYVPLFNVNQKIFPQQFYQNSTFQILCEEFLNTALNGVILPDDLLMTIFSYLDMEGLSTAKLVAKHWNGLITGTKNLNDKLKHPLANFLTKYQSVLNKLNTPIIIKMALVIGENVGKTSLGHRITRGKFLGDLEPDVPGFHFINFNKIKFQIFEHTYTFGEMRSISHGIQRNANIEIVCHDITKVVNYCAKDYVEQLKIAIERDHQIIFALTKSDLRNNSTTDFITEKEMTIFIDEFKKIAKEQYKKPIKVNYFACSAKTGEGIYKIWEEIVKQTVVPVIEQKKKELEAVVPKVNEDKSCKLM